MLFEVEHDEHESFHQGSSNNQLVRWRGQSPQAAPLRASGYSHPQLAPRQLELPPNHVVRCYEKGFYDVGRTLVALELPLPTGKQICLSPA